MYDRDDYSQRYLRLSYTAFKGVHFHKCACANMSTLWLFRDDLLIVSVFIHTPWESSWDQTTITAISRRWTLLKHFSHNHKIFTNQQYKIKLHPIQWHTALKIKGPNNTVSLCSFWQSESQRGDIPEKNKIIVQYQIGPLMEWKIHSNLMFHLIMWANTRNKQSKWVMKTKNKSKLS